MRTPRVAIFADIIKVGTIFINTIFKELKKIKELKLCIKMQFISVLLDIAKLADFRRKNADVSRTQDVCPIIHNFFQPF